MSRRESLERTARDDEARNVEMRESGELHELLRRAVGDGAAEQGLPESYVGFEGCDDF